MTQSTAMPETAPALPRQAQRVAWISLVGAVVIMAMKFGVFYLTNSAAVLSDALESIVNIVAASMVILSTWYAARPPDREHPYGHGRIEFMAAAIEGAMILAAAIIIAYESIRRLVLGADLADLGVGAWLLAGIGVCVAGLAYYVLRMGRHLDSPTLIADGKHLLSDAITSAGVVAGLALVQLTDLLWLDPLIAIALAAFIFYTGVRLVLESWNRLMDRIDPGDDLAIRNVLEREVSAGRILSYHKLRHRQQGSVRWVDLHIQLPGDMSVREAHDVASSVEHRIEQQLGRANATAHIEPPENHPPPGRPSDCNES